MEVIHRLYSRVSPKFRARRIEQFKTFFPPNPKLTILDIGGYPWFWNYFQLQDAYNITVLNPHMPDGAKRVAGNIKLVEGDGTKLFYKDRSFDLVFSNSVIEHLGNWENQQKFAAEALRVGRDLWVQTPARSFPIEPHYLTPFIHYFPPAFQKAVVRRGTVWGWLQKPTAAQAEAMVEELRLLDYREMRQLFAGCEILTEKAFGLTKSYIALRRI